MIRADKMILLVRLYRLQQDADNAGAGDNFGFDLDDTLQHYERRWKISHSEIQLAADEQARRES
jgi:hypothetical protein